MPVTMTTDFWQGAMSDDRVDASPSPSSLDQAIKCLDGKTRTLVTLEDDRGSALFIGGSPAGVVVAWSCDERHFIAYTGDDDEKVFVVAGGQAGDYAKRNVLSIDLACRIARAYLEGENILELANWEPSS